MKYSAINIKYENLSTLTGAFLLGGLSFSVNSNEKLNKDHILDSWYNIYLEKMFGLITFSMY